MKKILCIAVAVLIIFGYFPVAMQTANASSPRSDIIEIQKITASTQAAQVGEDISFIVTIQNKAPYKKHIMSICFNSSDGNFGCQNGKNLGPHEKFNINNSGRFTSGGTKKIFITWTQDKVNYYRPLNAGTASVFIYQ